MGFMKLVFEADPLKFEREDGGTIRIGCAFPVDEDQNDSGLHLRIQSWDESGTHPEASLLEGRSVQVTVEASAPAKRPTVRILGDLIVQGVVYRRCSLCKGLKPLDDFGLRLMLGCGVDGADLITNQSRCRSCR